MIGLLTRCAQQQFSRLGRPRYQGLAVVQGLSCDFASMIHAHERRGLQTIRLRLGRHHGVPDYISVGIARRRGVRDGPGRLSGSENGAQSPIGRGNQGVE
jgi:hypothetical protein